MRSTPRWKQSAEPRRVNAPMIASLVEQFPPGNDQDANFPFDASEGLSPQVEAASDAPVDAPPVEPEPDSIEAWRALVAKLQARIAEIETPDRLLLLKVAAHNEGVAYENLRRWYKGGKVTGEKRDGHVFINHGSLKAFLKPLRDRGEEV
jgi:hypothetical protein